MIKVEPLISAEDYPAFQAMMPEEPAFKDAPTGIRIDFATFSTRENIRIQTGAKSDKTVVMVRVQPDKFAQYCENYDNDRNWQSLANFAGAKFDMGLDKAGRPRMSFRAQATSSALGEPGWTAARGKRRF